MTTAIRPHRSLFQAPVLALLALLFGLVQSGCEGQQNLNKEAFAAAEAAVTAHEEYAEIFDHMEYQREFIVVYIKPGKSLPEQKGAVVQFVAKTMGDFLKAQETNKLKEITVKGNIEDEELWVFRYDIEDGQTYLEKSRLTTTL